MYISLYVMVTSHSTSVFWFSAAGVCTCIGTVCVCTGYGFPQCRCVFSQYWLWSPTVHVCWQFFTVYVCVLVMVSHSMCVCVLVMLSHKHMLTWLTAADNDSSISSVILCHPKYFCNGQNLSDLTGCDGPDM